MVDDAEVSVSMEMPLDSDGFLRRECPTCERELKWIYDPDEDGQPTIPDGGYFCPYCGIQAPPEGWLTKAQAELAANTLAIEGLGPLIEREGFKYKPPARMDPLTEIDDMKRVDFACHPDDSIKVLDDWQNLAYCPICGQQHSMSS